MKRPSPQDLPPFPLAIAACRRVWTERDELLRLGAAPLLLTFLLNLWSWHLLAPLFDIIESGKAPDPETANTLLPPLFLVGLLSWFLTSLFAVNWMRAMMLGSSAIGGLGLAISKRHVKFTFLIVAVQMVLGLVFLLIMLIVALIVPSMPLLTLVAIILSGAYLTAMLRLTPIWVGLAIDAPMTFAQAWRRTAHYGLRMTVAVILLACLMLLAQTILQFLFAVLGLIAAAPLATLFILLVIQFALAACVSTVLVIAYPRFVAETV